MNKLNTIILTVRIDSKRLPGKCLLPFSNSNQEKETVLYHVINRAKLENREIIVCTGTAKTNNFISDKCREKKIKIFRGDDNNKIKRWHDCFKEFGLEWAHFLDADDPFFCNDELDLSMASLLNTGDACFATSKSKSGNASVGMTLGENHLKKMYQEVGTQNTFEIIDDLIASLFNQGLKTIKSLDPIPAGTRLTLDYFEDYLTLSLIKIGLNTYVTRREILDFIIKNRWIIEINSSKNNEWRARQLEILREQGAYNE